MVTSLAHSYRPPNVTVSRMTITPEMAERWLAKNTENRNLREQKVQAYTRDMTAGRWLFNGDAIRFSQSGDLQDGQHRLWACVLSGASLDTLVIFNLPDAARDTLDGCISRTAADGLKFKKVPSAPLQAAIARRLVIWKVGRGSTRGGTYTPSKVEILDFAAEHDLTRATEVGNLARSLPVPPSAFGFTFYVCNEIAPATAELFYVQKLIRKIGLESGDPALALIRRMESTAMYGSQRGVSTRLTDEDVIRYTLLAWNHTRDGRKVTKLQAPRAGWLGKFPEPH